jgi:hypothetical protein
MVLPQLETYLEQPEGLDVVVGIQCKSVVYPCGQHNQVPLFDGNAYPSLCNKILSMRDSDVQRLERTIRSPHVEEATTIKDISNFLILMHMPIRGQSLVYIRTKRIKCNLLFKESLDLGLVQVS